METEHKAQPPALRESKRILGYIIDSYFDGPLLPTKGKADAANYVGSRMLCAQILDDPQFVSKKIEKYEILLRKAEAGNWNPMVKEIRRIGVDFMNMNDQESARTARALFNLAFSISPEKPS